MARPKKEKLDYYPKDTDQLSDRKIRRLLSDYGANGYLIYEHLLQLIYGGKGYFLIVDSNLAFDISDYLPSEITESMVNSTLKSCIEYGLFDKEMYENYQVLTNEAIQKNYYLAYRGSKFLLQKIIINAAETPVNAAQNLIFDEKQGVNADKCNNNYLDTSKSHEQEQKTKIKVENSVIVNSAQTPVNATITPITATQTPVIDVESAENRGEMPQKKRKENKVKEIKRKGKEKVKKKSPSKFDDKIEDFKNKKDEFDNDSVNEFSKQEKEKSCAKKEQENFNQCKRHFRGQFGSYIWEVSDDHHMNELLRKIAITLARDKLPLSPRQAFADYLHNLPAFWKNRRFSMQNLNQNYNEILNEIRQKPYEQTGKPKQAERKFGRHTTEELADFAENFGK